MFKTIYLTGAPASGKTTVSRELTKLNLNIALWSYSDELTRYMERKRGILATPKSLRQQSSTIIAPEDITEVDKLLINFVEGHRRSRHVIIDSHPVTREEYGFRCTMFSADQIGALAPDEIWVTYANPQTIVDRITANADGRRSIDTEAARMHTFLQASVATTYGIHAGRPVYFFDSNRSLNEFVDCLLARLT